MRPTVIPDWLARSWPAGRRAVIAAPGGDLTDPNVAPVEALVGLTELPDGTSTNAFAIACVMEGDDLDVLGRDAGVVVLTVLAHQLQPFDLQVVAEHPRKCAACGCADDAACDGGCAWVSADPLICSSCALVAMNEGDPHYIRLGAPIPVDLILDGLCCRHEVEGHLAQLLGVDVTDLHTDSLIITRKAQP